MVDDDSGKDCSLTLRSGDGVGIAVHWTGLDSKGLQRALVVRSVLSSRRALVALLTIGTVELVDDGSCGRIEVGGWTGMDGDGVK